MRLEIRPARRDLDDDPVGRSVNRSAGAPAGLAWVLLALALAGLLGSCASGPDLRRVLTISDRDIAEFSYEQAIDGGLRSFRQGLVNDGQIEPADYYSAPDTDPFTKVISTEQMQVLIDALAARGFFDYARASMAPGSVSRLALDLGNGRYVWSKQPGIQADELRAYNQALVDFQNVYNAVTSYHTGKGDNSVTERHRANVDRYRMERDLRESSGDAKR